MTTCNGIDWEKSFGSAASLREQIWAPSIAPYTAVLKHRKSLCVTNLKSYLILKTQTVLLRSHSPSQQNSKTIRLVGPIRKPNTAKALQTLFISGLAVRMETSRRPRECRERETSSKPGHKNEKKKKKLITEKRLNWTEIEQNGRGIVGIKAISRSWSTGNPGKVYEWPCHSIRDYAMMAVCPHAHSNRSLPDTSPVTSHYHLPTRCLLQSSFKCCLYHDAKAFAVVSPASAHERYLSYNQAGFSAYSTRLKRPPTWAKSGCHWFVSQEDRLRLKARGWGGGSLTGCQGLASAGVLRQLSVQEHLSSAR